MFASFSLRQRSKPAGEARPRTFAADDRGSVAILFALIIVALCLFVGGAVDFARWVQARHQTIAAMDAAVLAGGRMLQLNESVETARAVALRYYVENTKGRTPVVDDTISFDAVDNNTAFAAMGNAYIETSFLSFAHIDRLPLLDVAKAEFSKADLDMGGLYDSPIEISMMLDVTGSMGGSKIRDLRAAATDLVDIILSDHRMANPSRIAMIPFAESVRLPSSANARARGNPPDTVEVSSGWGWYSRSYTYYRTPCVVERAGANRYTDAAPGPGNYVMAFYNTSRQCGIDSDAQVVPLTTDKALLKRRISDLQASGTTAGHLGTAWAWYTLSPNWNALWDASSAATSYGGDTQKIAILMTDGEYNQQYDSQGISTSATGSGSAVNGSSDSQARSLCTNMKARGITVYTVGFALGRNSQAERTLNHCATDPTMSYTADTGAQLREAFRDIALKISKLHLTQ